MYLWPIYQWLSPVCRFPTINVEWLYNDTELNSSHCVYVHDDHEQNSCCNTYKIWMRYIAGSQCSWDTEKIHGRQRTVQISLVVSMKITGCHYNDVIMRAMASQITSLTIPYSTVYSGTDERTNQSSVSLAFVRGIRRWPVNTPHKWPVTRCRNISQPPCCTIM